MGFIHERAEWPRFIWAGDVLAAPLAAVRHRQGLHLGRMSALGFQLQTEASAESLTADVVRSSAIEGESLAPAEVRSSIAGRLGLDVGGLPLPGRQVEGVVEMTLDATQRYTEPLTKERLCGWHAALFPTGRSGIQRLTVGAWRPASSDPMQVRSGPVGCETVHFVAPAAARVPREMDRFLRAFEREDDLDPVLRAAVAHLWFVTIHPFDDGNGRIARAIADLALARADGTSARFYSMSSQLADERKDYYRELESAQRGGLDVTAWLLWFLGCLDRALGAADVLLAGVLRKAEVWRRLATREVDDRQRLVLNRMLGDWEGHLTSSKYAKLAKCSTDTALRDITELVAWGALVRNPGGGRSTSYRLADTAPEAS